MGSNKRRLSPKSRAFNERMLQRQFTRWGAGQVSDSFETPSNGFAKLHNARDHQEEVRGARGSYLWTPADIGIKLEVAPGELYDASETLGNAIQSGSLYSANGGAVPSVGTIFQIYNSIDFGGGSNPLYNAKVQKKDYDTDLLRAYDLFEITNNSLGEEAVEYVGNLSYPPFEKWYSRSAEYSAGTAILDADVAVVDADKGLYEIEVSSSFGGQPLSIFGDTSELKGNYFVLGHEFENYEDYIPERFFISEVDGTTLSVKGPKNFEPSTSTPGYRFCFVQAPIYAKYWSGLKKKIYIHTGRKLYTAGVEFRGWEEIPGMYKNPPIESEGEIDSNNDAEFLINNSGVFYIKDDAEESFYFKLNSIKPQQPPTAEPVNIFGFYREGYSSEGGNIINNDPEGNANNPIRVVGFPGKSDARNAGGLGLGRETFGGILL